MAALGCAPSALAVDGSPPGTLVRRVPFAQEDPTPLNQVVGDGLDGRLFTDLSDLTPQNLMTDTRHFYIRTCTPDRLKPTPVWRIKLRGGASVDAAALDRNRTSFGTHVMECSGNYRGGHFGLLSCASWEGVPLLDVVGAAPPGVSRILVSGFDEHSKPSTYSIAGASWIFTREQIANCGSFLATRMNGAPLTSDHGAPVRLLMPNWYGCTCIKWVNEIRWVGDDEPATSQMMEFASRTHQNGVPTLARDYQPAVMDLAAMPIRVEQWSVDGHTVYRVVGIQWGAGVPNERLVIRFAPQDPYVPVSGQSVPTRGVGWALWTHEWRPRVSGLHIVQLRVDDPSVRTRRLDMGYYIRYVEVEHV